MVEFTYEKQNRQNMYETYEWDNTWIEHADGSDAKRVLYIGDSISCQVRQFATKAAKEEILFDGYGSSKGIDNPYLLDSIKLFAVQQGRRDAVLFNNGLHGFHLEDMTEYRKHYERIILSLIDEFPDVPLAIVLTSHVADEQDEERVHSRNKVACEIAEKYNLNVLDLYSETLVLHDYLDEYGVHYSEKANEILGEKIVSFVQKLIEKANR